MLSILLVLGVASAATIPQNTSVDLTGNDKVQYFGFSNRYGAPYMKYDLSRLGLTAVSSSTTLPLRTTRHTLT